ncbi:mechanosensitive channel MscK [Conservatibacter flavescens]|uniref:Mechanosensitive channel MscK n=1 Tax=Conservatibacter flavescens TaxID=28161 RepID=A0A2M8S3V3_9PAST|nr:mechanosensitive channel MscK [Conservatibacter flavescens]PJG85835.1 mechanosensitive channel MscK [Conservatibacter flavescens]
MKKWLIFCCSWLMIWSAYAEDNRLQDLPNLSAITSQLEAATNAGADKTEIRLLDETQSLLHKIDEQKRLNEALNKEVAEANTSLQLSHKNSEKYREEMATNFEKSFADLTLNELQSRLNARQAELEKVQEELIELNNQGGGQSNVVSWVQTTLKENLTRTQELERLFVNASDDIQRNRYKTELALIALREAYHQTLLRENDKLRTLHEAKVEEKTSQQQALQVQIVALIEAINDRNLQASQDQVTQATQSEQQNVSNPTIASQLAINTRLSEDLLQQTKQMNELSQNNLYIKTVLDNLKQTQQYIENQINVLQGTLILSRVINKQRQDLPRDQIIKGLPKFITDLRVQIFNYTEVRSRLSEPKSAIEALAKEQNLVLSEKERLELEKIFQDRYKLLSDLINSLNNQLNLAVNIELYQQQVMSISDSLQQQLQQQSFWVPSNSVMDLEWFKQFPNRALWELTELSKTVDLSQISAHLGIIIAIGIALLLSYFVITWKKSAIKERLNTLAANVNTLKKDSHWHTPEALFWTVILALPSTFIFFGIVSFLGNIVFTNKSLLWILSLILSAHWLFFATVLSLLRPHGIAYLHFGMSPRSNESFRYAIKKSITMYVLFVVAFGFSYIESVDYSDDVLGEAMSLVALVMCQFVIFPLFNKAIKRYEHDAEEVGEVANTRWLKLSRAILVIVPISLMVLIFLGYYYTANVLIKHLLNSYLLVIAWFFARQLVYRIFTVSSRRMAYRRLQEKRQQIRQQENSDEKTKDNLELEEKNAIKISTVNRQLFQIADFVGWIILLVCFYLIWSDLISVAYYLDGFILWESGEGNHIETITLLNLMRTLFVLLITFALIRNLDGILEVLIFSRTRLSRGIAHTTTAILRYIVIVIGSIWAFSNLGLSWTKIQWIFTALSVGLGFGVREIFGSFISGLILLFDRPVRVGDKVTVGQYTGVVTQIRLRSTTLVDADNKDVVLPNQAFVTDRFINWTLHNTMTRVVIPVNIDYGTDLDLVAKLLHQAAAEAPRVLQDQAINVNFLAFGKNALEYELQVHVADLDDRVPATNFINYRINQLFKQHGVKIAIERLDVNIQNASTEQTVGT